MLTLLFNRYLNVPIIYRELPTAGTGDTREGELAVLPNPSLPLNSRADGHPGLRHLGSLTP